MKTQYIPCTSITYAHKGHVILLKYGIESRIKKPLRIAVGCGYSLEVEQRIAEKAIKILCDNGVKIDKKVKDVR